MEWRLFIKQMPFKPGLPIPQPPSLAREGETTCMISIIKKIDLLPLPSQGKGVGGLGNPGSW